MKNCSKCGEEKSFEMFYKNPDSKDGYRGYCKVCCEAISRVHDSTEHRKIQNQLSNKKYRESDAGRIANSNYIRSNRGKELRRKYYQASKHKVKAHGIVAKAIKNGELIRQACGVCGNEKVHAHHEDYDKPLDVVWLCHKHHMKLHATLK